MDDWASDLFEDYPHAAVRLTTLLEARVQHLLFACVELYPREMVLPPPAIDPLHRRFGKATIIMNVAPMATDEALSWYQSALVGDLKVPGRDVAISTLRLADEPRVGRLVIANDLPFAQNWHGGCRVHRLVPVEEFPAPVTRLSTGTKNPQQIEAREWLASHIGFDLLSYDDFLCGLVLLAPNPVVRGVGSFIRDIRPDGGETLRIRAALRQGMSADTLRVRLIEERPAGVTILESGLDRFGMTEFILPERCERTGLELVCGKRGVLDRQTPAHFFRSVHTNILMTDTQGVVEVPPRKKDGTSEKIQLQTVRSERSHPVAPPPMSGARRLDMLQTRRLARSGHSRPDGFRQGDDRDERIFFDDRLNAVLFVRGLVRGAREAVVFVDRYFNEIDVRDFALVTQADGVAVHILTGRGQNLSMSKETEEGELILAGDAFADDLSKLKLALDAMKRATPEVRLMGERARVYHDRFLVIDEAVWHFGHSFNKLGDDDATGVSMATRLRHPDDIRTMIQDDFARAAPFLSTWPTIKSRRSGT